MCNEEKKRLDQYSMYLAKLRKVKVTFRFPDTIFYDF